MGVAIALGMAAGLGLFLIVVGLSPAPVRLGDALASLDRRPPRSLGAAPPTRRGLMLPLTSEQQRLLGMQGREVGDFFTEKLILAATGLLLPGIWLLMQFMFGQPVTPMPLIWAPVGAVIGYVIPDVKLRRGASQQRRAMNDAIHTFFDLVALERLANASATQATAAAAEISDAPLFRRISAGIERARMEQVPPWEELRRIADEWRVPELADFADVMQLEEQGAALAHVLQARVKELRDAHLTRVKIEAGEASEQMTLWMTIPAMLLGLAFLTPALLRLTTM
jgi:tight adherence protein C